MHTQEGILLFPLSQTRKLRARDQSSAQELNPGLCDSSATPRRRRPLWAKTEKGRRDFVPSIRISWPEGTCHGTILVQPPAFLADLDCPFQGHRRCTDQQAARGGYGTPPAPPPGDSWYLAACPGSLPLITGLVHVHFQPYIQDVLGGSSMI